MTLLIQFNFWKDVSTIHNLHNYRQNALYNIFLDSNVPGAGMRKGRLHLVMNELPHFNVFIVCCLDLADTLHACLNVYVVQCRMGRLHLVVNELSHFNVGSIRVNTDRGINTDRELQTPIRRLPYGVPAKGPFLL